MLPLTPCFSTAELNSCLKILSNLPEGKIKLLAFSGKRKGKKKTCALSGRWVLNVTCGGNSRTGTRSYWFIEKRMHKTHRPPRGFVPLRCRGSAGRSDSPAPPPLICGRLRVILSCCREPMGLLPPADITAQPVPSSCRALQFLSFFKLKWRLVSCLKEYIALLLEPRC